MKRFFVFLISAVLLLSSFGVGAVEKEEHFYIKRGKDHAPPTTDPSYLRVFDENSFYLDAKSAECGEKRIYLTFDAGYENGNITKILDVLKEDLE